MNTDFQKTDADFIAEIKSRYEFHNTYAKKYLAMLNAADNVGLIEKTNGVIKQATTATVTTVTTTTSDKKTFDNVITDILSDGQPRTTRMLMNAYFQVTGREIDRKNFSSRLAIASKQKGEIKNAQYKQAALETKFWWGLKDWFDGASLKPAYNSKVSLTTKKGVNVGVPLL